MKPIIGITVDNLLSALPRQRYLVSATYAQAVSEAGGVPMMLAQLPERIDDYLAICDGLIFTGGDDPRMEPFGETTDPRVTPISSVRQTFETALLEALAHQPEKPALGVCLGMQLMGLVAGGRLDQFMPASMGPGQAAAHWDDRKHTVRDSLDGQASVVFGAAGIDGLEQDEVVSHHRQAVVDAGGLRVVATAPDGVIEAIDDPGRPFYAGVQWHPERGGPGPLHLGLIGRLVAAARGD